MRTGISFLIIIVFLVSCQKEIDSVNRGTSGGNGGNGNNGNNGALLTKIVSMSGSDSSSLTFGYNSSKKLMTLDILDETGGTLSLTQERVERNSQGIIQKLIIKNDQYVQAGVDSAITIVTYSSGRYISKVTSFDLGIIVLKDSVSLIYDANGNVSAERTYDDVGTGSYNESSKAEYTYSGKNIVAIKYYSYDPSTSSYILGETFTYDEYDNKVSPMSIGNEAFVFDSPELYSANNPTKSSVSATGSTTQTFTVSYTYNSANQPLTATSVVQPGNATTTGTYYYQ